MAKIQFFKRVKYECEVTGSPQTVFPVYVFLCMFNSETSAKTQCSSLPFCVIYKRSAIWRDKHNTGRLILSCDCFRNLNFSFLNGCFGLILILKYVNDIWSVLWESLAGVVWDFLTSGLKRACIMETVCKKQGNGKVQFNGIAHGRFPPMTNLISMLCFIVYLCVDVIILVYQQSRMKSIMTTIFLP